MRSHMILFALLSAAPLAAQDRAPAPQLISPLSHNSLTQAPRPIYARMPVQEPMSCFAPGFPGTPDITIPGSPGMPSVGDFPGTPPTPDIVIPGAPATPGYWYRCN